MNGILYRTQLVSSRSIGLLFGEILAKVEGVTFLSKEINRQQDMGTFTNLLL